MYLYNLAEHNITVYLLPCWRGDEKKKLKKYICKTWDYKQCRWRCNSS